MREYNNVINTILPVLIAELYAMSWFRCVDFAQCCFFLPQGIVVSFFFWRDELRSKSFHRPSVDFFMKRPAPSLQKVIKKEPIIIKVFHVANFSVDVMSLMTLLLHSLALLFFSISNSSIQYYVYTPTTTCERIHTANVLDPSAIIATQ
jgi:hypothetical protein